MKIRLYADKGVRDQFQVWAEALTEAGHQAGVVGLAPMAETQTEYSWNDICRYDDSRKPDQSERHRARAYGIAGFVEQNLAKSRPDVAVIWGDASSAQRATAAACERIGVPVVRSELGWFRRSPGVDRTTFFDTVGLAQRPTELSLEWWDKRLTPEEDARLDEYIQWWKSAKSSKHGQNDEPMPAEVAGDPQSPQADTRPLLLVLLQLDFDSACHYAQGITTQRGVMDAVRFAVGDDWRILVKEHPAGMRTSDPGSDEVWVKAVNLHDCLRIADCVVTANSNAGLEALLYEKPVICLADAPYGKLGFTFDCHDAYVLERMLLRMGSIEPPHLGNRFLRSFLHYVIFEYCFAPDEAGALAEKIERRVLSQLLEEVEAGEPSTSSPAAAHGG